MRHPLPLFAAVVTAAVTLSAVPSFADRAGADKCAAGLPANSKLIYAASITGVKTGIDLKDLVRSKTRSLVMEGKVVRAEAQGAAEAAGSCLKQAL